MNIDAEAALEAAQSDEIKSRLRAQTEEAQQLGIFGAPSFTTADGELFWGNDRLEQALAWAKRETNRRLRIEPHRQAGLRHVLLGLRAP